MPDNSNQEKENKLINFESNDSKLITVTRQDLAGGYQTVQTAHAVADFAHQFPDSFSKWKQDSNSIICLSVKDENELFSLSERLLRKGIQHSKFYEPDVNNQLTAIALEPSQESRKATSSLSLANKKTGEVNKHNIPDLTLEECERRMKETFQFESQSVYDHGVSVWNYFQKILCVLNDKCKYPDVLVPEHILENRDPVIKVINEIGLSTIREYCIYHDIGKPFCREIDAQGKQHFPNHEQVSYEVYKKISDNELLAEMILHDMDIHYAKPSQMDDYLKMSFDRQILHMIVGLAELLSNAQMFGGLESTGFKIKYKNFNKVSKKILEQIK